MAFGHGSPTTEQGRMNQVWGIVIFIGGLVWCAKRGEDSLGPWVTLFGVFLWSLGRLQEWIGR
jgi:hypothetical protein